MIKIWLSLTAIVFSVVATFVGLRMQTQEVPGGFEQILPRGGIPAIDDPEYVTADKAKIADESYVFGVFIEGQPVAYSLNLLNSHEVVNDTIGKTNFAAVW